MSKVSRSLVMMTLLVWPAIGPVGEAATSTTPIVQAASDIEAGRYLVIVGACNDCHTDGWAETNGEVPEQDWLKGSAIGWRGPWGTTYPSNLRILVNDMSENAWVTMLRTRTERPPMPWMNVNRFSETDARALYRFIRSLGVSGERAPLAVAPDVEPVTPFFVLEPTGPRQLEAATTGTDSAK